jgi:hypothetical protein
VLDLLDIGQGLPVSLGGGALESERAPAFLARLALEGRVNDVSGMDLAFLYHGGDRDSQLGGLAIQGKPAAAARQGILQRPDPF